MKKIMFTGGGTAGHITPNLALIQALRKQYRENAPLIAYLGGKGEMDREMVEKEGIPYYAVSGGKLRRYRSLKNFSDPFRVLAGIIQSIRILKREKPDLLFSKGGFVAVPPILAAALLRIPIIIHESDYSPGLATKIAARFARKICLTFPDTAKYFPKKECILTGTPIRQSLFQGNADAGYRLSGFTADKPVLLIMGGSQGSQAINRALFPLLPVLTEEFQILHIVGKGNLKECPARTDAYAPFEFLGKELADVLAITDYVVSRAGSNAIFEFLNLKKPMLLIPLPLSASRGDQILNARFFEKEGYALTLDQDSMDAEMLLQKIRELPLRRAEILSHMKTSPDAEKAILSLFTPFLFS